jgi:hypothetical protein
MKGGHQGPQADVIGFNLTITTVDRGQPIIQTLLNSSQSQIPHQTISNQGQQAENTNSQSSQNQRLVNKNFQMVNL